MNGTQERAEAAMRAIGDTCHRRAARCTCHRGPPRPARPPRVSPAGRPRPACLAAVARPRRRGHRRGRASRSRLSWSGPRRRSPRACRALPQVGAGGLRLAPMACRGTSWRCPAFGSYAYMPLTSPGSSRRRSRGSSSARRPPARRWPLWRRRMACTFNVVTGAADDRHLRRRRDQLPARRKDRQHDLDARPGTCCGSPRAQSHVARLTRLLGAGRPERDRGRAFPGRHRTRRGLPAVLRPVLVVGERASPADRVVGGNRQGAALLGEGSGTHRSLDACRRVHARTVRHQRHGRRTALDTRRPRTRLRVERYRDQGA